MAVHSYHDTENCFPPVSITDRHFLSYSSMYLRLLPYLDQGPLYSSINFSVPSIPLEIPGLSNTLPGFVWATLVNSTASTTRLSVMSCVSDSQSSDSAGTNYRGNTGVGPEGHAFAEFRDSGNGLFPEIEFVRFSSVTDGLSNTAAFSERIKGSFRPDSVDSARDYYILRTPVETVDQLLLGCRASARQGRSAFVFGGLWWFWTGRERTLYNHGQTPNGLIPDCLYPAMITAAGMSTARSLHSNGVNVAMGDGSVRFVANQISRSVWIAIGSRNGAESIGEW